MSDLDLWCTEEKTMSGRVSGGPFAVANEKLEIIANPSGGRCGDWEKCRMARELLELREKVKKSDAAWDRLWTACVAFQNYRTGKETPDA